MNIDLDATDLVVLLESLEYSRQRVREAQGTPPDVRQENLRRLDTVSEKLRNARKR
jgi:hypothetical protein